MSGGAESDLGIGAITLRKGFNGQRVAKYVAIPAVLFLLLVTPFVSAAPSNLPAGAPASNDQALAIENGDDVDPPVIQGEVEEVAQRAADVEVEPNAAEPEDSTTIAVLKNFNENARLAAEALNQSHSEDVTDIAALASQQKRLEELRELLAGDRDLAHELAERGTLQTRLLQAQLDAIGPPPADGKTEPIAVAQRREELDLRLAEFITPVLGIREAEVRAATLVDELDQRAVELEKLRLWTHDYPPIDPRLWTYGITQWGEALETFASQVRNGWSRISPADFATGLFTSLTLLFLGPVLMLGVGRGLIVRHMQRRFRRAPTKARKLVIALVEDVLVMALVIIAIMFGIVAFGLPLMMILDVDLAEHLLAALFAVALLVGFANWLGQSILRSPFPELRLIRLEAEQAKRGVELIRRLGILLAFTELLGVGEEAAWLGSQAVSLGSVIMIAIGCWLTWKLANTIAYNSLSGPLMEKPLLDAAPEGNPARELEFAEPLSRALKIIVIIAVVAAVIGFLSLARWLFASIILSLAVIAMAVFLHRSIKLVVELMVSSGFTRYVRSLSLVPVMTGFAILLITLPVLAIIWGYRIQEIGDAITRLRTGVSFGDVTLSAGDFLTFVVVFIVGFFLTRWIQRILAIAVLPKTGVDHGGQAAIVTGIGYLGLLLAAGVAFASTGLDLSSLAFVFGALSVGLGFGLQKVVENFTSGILLLIERPIREGDWVEVADYSGIVRKISVRATHVETFDRHMIIIPNSEFITSSVKNLSIGGAAARIIVPIGVAYGSDLELVRETLLDIAAASDDVLANPEPIVAMDGFGDSSIDMKLLCFVADATTGAGAVSAIRFQIAKRFQELDIEIPFPQRDLNIRGLSSKEKGPER